MRQSGDTRRAGRSQEPDNAPLYGAVDLGTNNCRLLMARPEGEGFRVVDSFSRIVRLGEGLAASGRLANAAIERTIKALKVCAGKFRERGVRRVRNVATEACRRASNGAEFLARVKDETGLKLESIPEIEEARLTLAGCAPLLQPDRRFAVVFDIGGGSTELMWVEYDGSGPKGVRIKDMLSLPIGVVTLADHYGELSVTDPHYAAIVERFHDHLITFCVKNRIAERIARDEVQMLGTSGTVTTLGAVHLGLLRYDRARVDGLTVDFASLVSVNRGLAALSWEERCTHPCIGRGRADLVIMGCAILEAICSRWPVSHLRIADRGIREGLLLGMMAEDGVLMLPETTPPAKSASPDGARA